MTIVEQIKSATDGLAPGIAAIAARRNSFCTRGPSRSKDLRRMPAG
ncbi:hypothetical protein CHELA40_14895 [Chelatococcus asaccharovorans]|nr:hypothetical protein CHELA17_60727 [Chelatococcus asaccharovorans]CAH1680615.1 hypothetical protein CHELA40_14895 [Chelatococcus asaccharovorans]